MHGTALDEMVDGHGGVRPHWRPLLGVIAGLGWDALGERARRMDESFAELGATSPLQDPPASDPALPWRCDPIPLVLSETEFTALAEGLAQRARLIEATLADCLGPQRLLAEGVLPPGLVLGNPGFLRPCRFLPGPMLQLYAADLIRGPDGAWRVVADRTAAPGGLAHALEHRELLARFVPELFTTRPIRPLRPFFELWQDALQRAAPPGAGQVVALMTTARDGFEPALLARELSCALVEGGDLTVRGGALYLKTLSGLARVAVLLRRQEGARVDPLELDPDPSQGVAGLLDAARQGAVVIVNHPGAGLAEMPALAAFLPALAPRLIGEKLALGQAEARRRTRFQAFGHTPGAMEAPIGDTAPESPRTLDLRRYG
ncbi:MAG TPA: circularly permuted type 2 ATP-grasp protein [Crenalkalicoccus sp.]|nr:circularly permuted type 2 ATP-grasp protein [Crenalkalicoccus sp.]